MTKEAYYFSHDSNARHDPRIVRLLRDFGHESYGIYWMIIEMMRDENTHRIEADPNLIAYAIRYEKDLAPMLDRMIELGLFQVDDEGLFSPSLDRRMALRNARKRAGKKGGKGRSKANPKQTPSKTQANSKQNASKSEAPASSLLEANLKPKGKERKGKGKEIKVNTTSNEAVARARAASDVEVDELMVEFCKMKAPDLDVDVFLDYFKLRCKEEPQKYTYSDYRLAFQRWCLTEQKRISDGEGSQFAKAARKEDQSGPSFYDSAEFKAGNKILDDDLKRFKEEQARRLSA